MQKSRDIAFLLLNMDCQVTLEPLCTLRQLTCSFEVLIVVTLKVTSSWYVAAYLLTYSMVQSPS